LIVGSNDTGTGLPSSWSLDVEMQFYLDHWIPGEWYYHFSSRSDPVWKQGALLVMDFLVAAIILLLVDQPSERLREAWVVLAKEKVTEERQKAAEGKIYRGDTEITEFPELNTGQLTPSRKHRVTENRRPRHKSDFFIL
jgi:peptidoglycan/LPS O-acetylase OafA/YrhL